MELVKGILGQREDLAAAARLLYDFGFDRVELEQPRLGYEPRWSCKCEDCAAVWLASKSGEVMRVDLRERAPRQRWFPGNREARTVYHVHDGGALRDGRRGGSVLLIGRDNGTLDVIPDDHDGWTARQPEHNDRKSVVSLPIAAWDASGDRRPRRLASAFPHASDPLTSYAVGITALAVLPRPRQRDALDILVATRHPRLYVIEARRGQVRLSRPIELPGWIEWILAPGPDAPVTCISRGGDVLRFTPDELRAGRPGRSTRLPVLPTSAMPLDDGTALLGTTTGLFLLRDRRARPRARELALKTIAVPITRSPVLCLDRTRVVRSKEPHDYISMGLADGRLRVIDTQLLLERADGHGPDHPRGEAELHSFAVGRGSAVLALETLAPRADRSDAAYVLAALRDHKVRLFRVTGQPAQRAAVEQRWLAEVGCRSRPASPVRRELAAATARARLAAATPAGHDRYAWQCMLVDVVLPRLRARVTPGSTEHRDVVALARTIATTTNRVVLYRLSAAMTALAVTVPLVLELSLAILLAVPHRRDEAWDVFIRQHLHDLNAIARGAEAGERTRLVAWARFVRKYVLLGHTFGEKQLQLGELVAYNRDASKHLDALIYQARLSARCYDLHWQTRAAGELAALHPIALEHRAIVVVVTAAGVVSVVDSATGARQALRGPGVTHDTLEPYRPRRTQILASAAAYDAEHRRLRVVLADRAPNGGLVAIAATWRKGAWTCTTEVLPGPTVYAIQPVPRRPAAFIVGLDTGRVPVWLVQHTGKVWTALPEPTTAARAIPFDAQRGEDWVPSAYGELPTRALAIGFDETSARYLVVAGSDDGLVRACSFAWGEPVERWHRRSWDRVAHAITSIALGDHPQASLEGDASVFTCYLGTTGGDSFALSILRRRGAVDGYDAEPLWRETHDGPVLAIRLWQTPLYRTDDDAPDEVLVVVTEKGTLTTYKHSFTQRPRVSALANYYFRGMRFDRLELPDRVRAIAMLPHGPHLVAGGVGGEIYLTEMLYVRDSAERARMGPDQDMPYYELGHAIWTQQGKLLDATTHQRQFDATDEEAARRRQLELCAVVRLERGALASYALAVRLLTLDRWPSDPDALRARAHELLGPLDPEVAEHEAQIKIVIKSLCRAFLYRDPQTMMGQLIASTPPVEHEAIAAVCAVASHYLIHDLATPTAAAARLRTVVIKELLCVAALRHLAWPDAHGERIRAAITTVLDTGMRDPDRLVAIETLRALAVALRNIGVMADDVPPANRADFVAAVFPDGLGSLDWLLALIVGGLQRHPSFTRRTALVSGAWFLISVLLQLFRIFRDHTLALCDYLVRADLGIEVIAMCFRSMRGTTPARTRARIEILYLLPVLGSTNARQAFIADYDRRKRIAASLEHGLELAPGVARPDDGKWHQIVDDVMAPRLIHLLDQLARMWDARELAQLDDAVADYQPARPLPAPLHAALEDVVRDLVKHARALASPGTSKPATIAELAAARERHCVVIEGRSRLTPPLRELVTEIARAWTELYHQSIANPADQVGDYQAGARICAGGLGSLYQLGKPVEMSNDHVIKVLRDAPSRDAVARFLTNARFHHQLAAAQITTQYTTSVVDIIEPRRDDDVAGYVLHSADGPLCHHLKQPRDGLSPADRKRLDWTDPVSWIERLALHIGLALQTAHLLDHGCHGRLGPEAIFVDFKDRFPTFRLGDFEPASEDAAGVCPRWLAAKYAGDDAIGQRRWEDLGGLAHILYDLLIEQPGGADNGLARAERLRAWDAKHDARMADCTHAPGLVGALIEVFTARATFGITEFMTSLLRRKEAPALPASIEVLFLGSNSWNMPESEVTTELAKVSDRLRYAGLHDVCKILPVWHEQADRLSDRIVGGRPTVLHFSGHGNADGQLVLQDPSGFAAPADMDAITRVFKHTRQYVRCVVLSACYSSQQAEAIARHVDIAIGIDGPIWNDHAPIFAGAFYMAIACGETVEVAFARACEELAHPGQWGGSLTSGAMLRDTRPHDAPPGNGQRLSAEPRMFLRAGVDARTLRLVERRVR